MSTDLSTSPWNRYTGVESLRMRYIGLSCRARAAFSSTGPPKTIRGLLGRQPSLGDRWIGEIRDRVERHFTAKRWRIIAGEGGIAGEILGVAQGRHQRKMSTRRAPKGRDASGIDAVLLGVFDEKPQGVPTVDHAIEEGRLAIGEAILNGRTDNPCLAAVLDDLGVVGSHDAVSAPRDPSPTVNVQQQGGWLLRQILVGSAGPIAGPGHRPSYTQRRL